MRVVGVKALMAALFVGVSAGAFAQQAGAARQSDPKMTPLELAIACAPPPSLEVPSSPLHVVGAQDTVPRTVFDPRDLLVVSGGTQAGVQLGQQYFVRRPTYFAKSRTSLIPNFILTLGWVRVVAVNESTAIAAVDHYCGPIYSDDYLETFNSPSVPNELGKDDPSGELDFSTLFRVTSGIEDHTAAVRNDLVLVDRGVDQGAKVGDRFAIYRDLKTSGMPLAAVGEGVMVVIGQSMAIARVTRSRDAVVPGDYVVPRK
jgi:hypothetical protein